MLQALLLSVQQMQRLVYKRLHRSHQQIPE